MKTVYKIDAKGFYLYPVTVDETPSDCVEIRPPNGLFKGRFVDGNWIEGATQEEINAIVSAPKPLSEIELLKKQQTDLVFELMMKGVL